MSDRPDFEGAGWGWSGAGDEDRLRIPRPAEPGIYKLVPKKGLEELQDTLLEIDKIYKLEKVDEATYKATVERLCAATWILQERYAKLRRDYWHNIARAFAFGVLVAWLLWSLLGAMP